MDSPSQKQFAVRKATLQDANAILVCLHSAFISYQGEYTREAYEQTVLGQETIKSRMTTMQLFVAVSAGGIVGTVACEAKGYDGHLRGMAVLPAWQGAGVAPALLRAAEAELRLRGCRRVTLGTVAPLNRAIHFYQQNGFVPSGRIADFFGMHLYEYTKSI